MCRHLEPSQPPRCSRKEILLPRRNSHVSLPRSGPHYMRGVSIFGQSHHTSTFDIYIHSLSIHPNNRDPPLYDAVRSLVAFTRGYIRVLLRRQAWPERSLSTHRPSSPFFHFDSASKSTTKVNTYGSSNARGPVSRPSSGAPPSTPSAFYHPDHGHGHLGQPPPNSEPQGYPVRMTQQAPSQTSLAFRSPLFRLRRAPLSWVFVPSIGGDWL